ncbi:putative chloride channel, voltage gated, chloride channel, core [Helianthus annuus]|nr:putative chloride channel, voltage gated, chloride channel, core [Helianthus annuus]KAJ0542403.1 putative chloride channel, voltage gated, chloride channel, core [Helianthus annuus]KAJ0707444.1 putative chloride channel, voltage gated, chloride channel, core [Helianthus annuus]KAJ0711451.1 putative chloride channel, voltage gated, chloride channel, core [Helianthus annuus]KAJ0888199.1 putative chloride channel, voltage gated, chloride channel, core [Helianthus annuus]
MAETTTTTEEQTNQQERDPECNSLHQPLLKRNRTLSSSPLALVGTKVSYIESLDYEINENDLFKHDWRTRSQAQVLQYVFLKWLLAFLVGLLTGVIATLINLAVENIAGYKLLAVTHYIDRKRYMMGFFLMTGVNFVLTLMSTLLVVFFAPTAAGPGIPEIKAYLNGVDTPNMYGASTMFVKIIGSIGAVAAGLDLGKEGPLVHIGACIASLLAQGGPDNHRIRWKWIRYFNNDRDRRDIITCGASSGVCAAFRSPVGGVLFALEEVATWWRSALLWRTFFSTAVVVVVLRAFMEFCKSGECGLFGEGGLIMFDVSGVSVNYHLVDLIPVTVIGIIGGVLGSLYNYALHKVLRLYNLINEKGKLAKILLSLSVSLFTSACLYGLPFLASCTPCDPSAPLDTECPSTGRMGNFKKFNCPKGHYNDLATLLLTTNDDAVRNIFSTNTPSEYRVFSLFIFFILYCILGLFTFGIAVPSGLFLPIILMGSAYGRLLGMAMGPYTTIDQGLFAVLGAASLMAGSMRMTVSLCVIFLELTNNLLLLPITMLVLLISKSVGDCFNPSIYEIILELKGLPFLEAHPEPWMRNITVGELADVKPPMVTLSGIEKVGRIVEVLRNTTHNAFAVVDNTMVPMVGQMSEVHGLVLRAHLLLVLKKKWFLQERRRTEEWEVREKFTQVGLRHMLVLPKYHGPSVPPVVGILTRQDLRAHNILSAFPHLEKSYASKKGR